MKTLNEKLNSSGKDYKKNDTALIIFVECKMPSCFDMFIQTRNRALKLSQSTMKQTFDDFCKGLTNEQEWLIVSGQLTLNKALTALNKNHKKSFNNAKGYNHSNTNSGHASHASNENSKQKKVYDPCKHCGKTNHPEKNCFKAKRLMAKAKKKTSHDSQVALCASVVLPNSSSSNVEWIMDSGASKHMTGDASLFTSYDCRGYLVPICV